MLLYTNLQLTFFLSEKQRFELGILKFLHSLTLFSYTEFSISHLPLGFSLTLSNLEQEPGRRNGSPADDNPRSVCEVFALNLLLQIIYQLTYEIPDEDILMKNAS